MASRSSVKIELDEQITKNSVLLKEIQALNDIVEDYKKDRDRYSMKHDEMFSSVG